MKPIRLVQLDRKTEQALEDDPRYFASMADEDWATLAEVVYGVVGATLDTLPADDAPLCWSGYLVADAQTRAVVGSCAFKGPPSDQGEVEIAYFTYPPHQRRGYATAMAARLIELAASSPDVTTIIAHTLPEKNASTAVLEKNGLQFAGTLHDPDDGPIWRWEKTCPA